MAKCTSIQEAPPKLFDRKFVFSVHLNSKKPLVLSAPNAEEAEEWIDVLGDSVPEDTGIPSFVPEEEEKPVIQGFLTKQGGHRKVNLPAALTIP